jgi:RNase P subunit RPR2
MKLHAFPVSVSDQLCTTCGGPLDPAAECPLTEKSAPWAERFGVRCPECEEVKRAHMVGIKRLAAARRAEGR